MPKIVKHNNVSEITDLLRYWPMLEIFRRQHWSKTTLKALCMSKHLSFVSIINCILRSSQVLQITAEKSAHEYLNRLEQCWIRYNFSGLNVGNTLNVSVLDLECCWRFYIKFPPWLSIANWFLPMTKLLTWSRWLVTIDGSSAVGK